MTPDYIPAPDLDADAWGSNFAALITANPTDFGLVVGDATTIQTASDDFTAALTLALDPATRTPVTVNAKDAQRQTSEAVWRPYAMQINANPAVTDAQRTSLGLTVRDTDRTPVPPPASAPALDLRASTPGVTKLGYSDTAAPSGKAKPDGSIGVEIWRAIGGAPAPDPSTAAYLQTVTKSPFDAANLPADVGQTATYFGRFVTRSGPGGISQAGPWSAGLAVTIT